MLSTINAEYIIGRQKSLGRHGAQPVRSYLRGEAENVRSVEVEQVALAQLTIDHLPLFVQPALWRILLALKYDLVALEAACEVIPSRGNQCILSL